MINLSGLSREDLAGELSVFCMQSGMSQADVARALGYSDSRLSAWKKGTYAGNVDMTTRNVRQFLETKLRQMEDKRPEFNFAETAQSKDITSVVNFCQIKNKMGLVHGPSGVGKTTTLEHLARNNSNVAMITAFSGINRSELLSEILLAMNRPVKRQNKTMLLQAIKFELKKSTKVIIVDEAQKCNFEVLEMLRHLWDTTGVGIVFCGTDDTVDRMKGKGSIEYDQIYSRLAIKLKLKKTVAKDDVGAILKSSGIKFDPSNGILKYAHEIAKRQGHLRTLFNHIEMAVEIARENSPGGELRISVNDFRTAGQMLWRED